MLKRNIIFALCVLCGTLAGAQTYRTGTSKTTTDYWGNKKTEHTDPYGRSTGTSTTTTDYWGNTKTEHTDSRGRHIGTSTTTTDYWGNKKTEHQSNNGNSVFRTW